MDTAALDPRLRDNASDTVQGTPITKHPQQQQQPPPPPPLQVANLVQQQQQTQQHNDRAVVPTAAAAAASPLQQQSHTQQQTQTPPVLQQTQAHAHAHAQPQPTTPAYTSSFSPQTPSSATAGAPTPATANNASFTDGSGNGNGHTPDHLYTGGVGGDVKKQRACESCRGLKVRCEPDLANPNPDGPCRRCAKAGRQCVVTQPTRKRQKKTDNRVTELEKKIDALTASLQATRHGGHSTTGSGGSIGNAAGGGGGGSIASVAPVAAVVGGGGLGMMGTVQSVQHIKPEESSRATVSPVVGGGRGWVGAAREKLSTAAATPSTVAAAQPQRPASSIGGMDLDDRVYPPPMVMAGQKRKLAEMARDTTSTAGGVVGGASGDQAARSEAMLAPSQTTSGGGATDYSDVVDRGILTMAQAGELFARYTDQMCPHLPGVVFTPGTTVAEVRKSKPTLFLSVMAAASSEIPDIQKILTKELMQVLADKVMVVGKKSLELVQALQVAVVWYWPPEHFEELKFYQLVHVAAVMAIDLGLGRKKQARGGFRKHIPHSWRDHPLRKNLPPDPTTIEARRAWLTCYFLATNTSMALHRPNLIRWTPFMAECVDVLESSPEAAPTDKYLCHLVWTHKLAEEVGIQFSMDDPACTPNISDSRTQYALRGFERDLERYSSSIPPDMHQPSLKLSFHVLSLYMHEIATQTDFTEDNSSSSSSSKQQPPQPCSIDSLKEALVSEAPLTAAHINALSACLTAIDGIFDVFLSLNVTAIRCLPVFNFVRVAYAVVVLIKMYFAASSPKSELGKVINKDNMKVEQHLEALLEKFRATAADDRSRPASKFLVVLVMLRSWFQKQNQNGGPPAPGREGREECSSAGTPAAPTTTTQTPQVPSTGGQFVRKESMPPPLPPQQQQQQQQQQNDYSSNTPLQLLSEIATKGSGGGNGMGMTTPTPTGTNWNRMQPSYMWDTPTTTTTAADTPGTVTSGGGGSITDGGGGGGGGHMHGQSDVGPPMPWLNNAFVTDFDYNSLGFAQAMDLTFANLTNPAGLSMENPGLYDIAMQQDPSMWFSPAGGLGSSSTTLEDMGASGGLGTNFY